MMWNDHGIFWGMHWFWWALWIIFLIWIFVLPYNIPGQRLERETPMDILKKKYAAGEMSTEEYEERKRILERDSDVRKK